MRVVDGDDDVHLYDPIAQVTACYIVPCSVRSENGEITTGNDVGASACPCVLARVGAYACGGVRD